MEHKPLSELETIADVKRAETVFLTREQRLERWIEALEAQPNRPLRPLSRSNTALAMNGESVGLITPP